MTKRAVLMGCNYPGSQYPLNGCANDVFGYKNMLEMYYGFDSSDIRIMLDTDPSYPSPTGENIKATLRDVVAHSEEGDVLFVHFSGHGTQTPGAFDEADGKNENLVAADFNLLVDHDMKDIFAPLPPSVHFTYIADCCHSGGILDGAVVVIAGEKEELAEAAAAGEDRDIGPEVTNRSLPPEALFASLSERAGAPVETGNLAATLFGLFGSNASSRALGFLSSAQPDILAALGNLNLGPPPSFNPDVAILITGCQAGETSADACPSGDPTQAFGALSNSIQTLIRYHFEKGNGNLTNWQVVMGVRKMLAKGRYTQSPQLECTEENARKPFICAV